MRPPLIYSRTIDLWLPILRLDGLSFVKTSTNPMNLELILRQSFLILYERWAFFDDWNFAWNLEFKAYLKRFCEQKYRSLTALPTMLQEELAEGELDNSFLQCMEEKSTVLDGSDELERYLSEPRLDKTSSALDWWKDSAQRSHFPFPYLMALDIFSILAMSSVPKRVFSGARKMLSYSQSSLNIESIQTTQCLRLWSQSGLFIKLEIGTALAEYAIDNF